MLRHLNAVHIRHANVEQHDVGITGRQQIERTPAVISLAGDFKRHFQRTVAEQVAQPVARWRLVVDHHDAQRTRPGHGFSFT